MTIHVMQDPVEDADIHIADTEKASPIDHVTILTSDF